MSGGYDARQNLTYDGVDLIAEYDASGAVLRRYLHGSGTDDPQVWLEGSGSSDVRYVYANAQGSVIAWVKSDNSASETYAYGPYGEPKDTSGTDSWSGFRFRYTGQTMLGDARLYYYKARVYDPVMGRFLQTDPIGSKDDLDLYAYVGGDPINRGDPTGLCLEDACVGEAAVACAANPVCRGTVGGVFGAVINAGGTIISKATDEQPGGASLKDIAISGAAGFADGAMVANGVNPALSGAVTNGAGTLVGEASSGGFKDLSSAASSLTKTGIAATGGALGGGAGAKIGEAVGIKTVETTLSKSIPNAMMRGVATRDVVGGVVSATTGTAVGAGVADPAGKAAANQVNRGINTLGNWMQKQACRYGGSRFCN